MACVQQMQSDSVQLPHYVKEQALGPVTARVTPNHAVGNN
jgi:hypothetical protein